MFDDKPLPFVPFTSKMLPSLLVGDFRRASEIALMDTETVEKAIIKVEDINGPILLISGEKDQVWPSKEMRDAGWQAFMQDPRMDPEQNPMPFDVKRLIYGGFDVIVQK